MSRHRERQKGPVTLTSAGPDGKPKIDKIVSWEEAFGNLPKGSQARIEYGYAHNNILMKESDRAVAVLGHSYLDANLGDLLRTVFGDREQVAKDLLNGRLRDFSVRTKLCYAMGLITLETYNDLSRVNDIRNEFAHGVNLHSLEDEPVRSQTKTFDALKQFPPHVANDPFFSMSRNRLLITLGDLINQIGNALDRAAGAR